MCHLLDLKLSGPDYYCGLKLATTNIVESLNIEYPTKFLVAEKDDKQKFDLAIGTKSSKTPQSNHGTRSDLWHGR